MLEILEFVFLSENFWKLLVLVVFIFQWQPIKITKKYYYNTTNEVDKVDE